mmetsp:Transcript_17878/g.15788  ORF Transcript_17878/g.15788 Transcript_17878/m.15788 type:complete len:338 (+) Transcript_17878:61-1074(+)
MDLPREVLRNPRRRMSNKEGFYNPDKIISKIDYLKCLLDFFSKKIYGMKEETFSEKFMSDNVTYFNQIISEYKDLKSSIKILLHKTDAFQLLFTEGEINKLVEKLRGSTVYQKICEIVCMEVIFKKDSRKYSSPNLVKEEELHEEKEKDKTILQLQLQLKHFAEIDKEKQDYVHQYTQKNEKLKNNNYELNIMLQKLRSSSEREINAREIEINELNKRIEGFLKTSKLKKTNPKPIVIDYTELNKDIEVKDENIKTLNYDSLQDKLIQIYGPQNVKVNENLVLEINCDHIVSHRLMSVLIDKEAGKIRQVFQLPTIKRLRLENIISMLGDIKLMLKY